MTVFGLADDGMFPKTPFLQIRFDPALYTSQIALITIGGNDKYPTLQIPLNVSSL